MTKCRACTRLTEAERLMRSRTAGLAHACHDYERENLIVLPRVVKMMRTKVLKSRSRLMATRDKQRMHYQQAHTAI